jgi:hypothetical protein
MPPTRTQTSVGLETPQQTMDRASALLKRTGFNAQIPDSIPSTAISDGGTFSDVRSMRDTMEGDQLSRQQFDTDFNNLMGRVQSPLQSSPFQNPERFINEMLLRRPSETETQLGNAQGEQAQGLRDIGGDLNKTREKLTSEFDISGLQSNLADTRNRIAERTTLLRQSLRDFETNAEKRGVARGFVDAEKQKVQADAAAELADLAIIESAQSGNLQMAREDIDRALNQKIQAFEFENMAIQAEIQRLEKMDSKESEARSQQLQMALGERTRLVEQAVADERQKLEYLSVAAANGADQGTLDAIRKATNVGEAAMMAGPFIGRLDRQRLQSQMYTESLQQQKLLQELNPSGDVGVSADLAAYGNEYVKTGVLPSPSALKSAGLTAGDVAEYAKQLPQTSGALVSVNTGTVNTKVGAAEQEDIKRLYNITKMVDELKELDKQRVGGVIAGTYGKVTGSEAQGAYLARRKAIVDEIARMQTGAALTVDEQNFYNEYLPGRFSESFFLGQGSDKKIENFSKLMNDKLTNVLSNNQMSIYGYSKVKTDFGDRTVGEILDIGGVQYRVLPDGNLTDII